MRSWWGKSSSKEAKKKPSKESFIDTLQRKLKFPSEGKSSSQKQRSDTVSRNQFLSRPVSRSTSPSKHVGRCQSFAERPQAQPLPLPCHAGVARTESSLAKPRQGKGAKPLLFLPLPKPGCIQNRLDHPEFDGDLMTASVSSDCSVDSDDPGDSSQRSPLASDCDLGNGTASGSPSR